VNRLVSEVAPQLIAVEGIATDTVASLLIAAGDSPQRMRNEAAFTHLCGVASIPASSGKTGIIDSTATVIVGFDPLSWTDQS
jgi:transposase